MASPSSSGSLDHSRGSVRQPLDSLIPHLLASKRSLASISHIYRANSIVTSARAILEQSVAGSARTTFLRRGLSSQLHILRAVQFELEDVVSNAQKDFNASLKELDTAEARLRKTLDALGKTPVIHGPQQEEAEHQTLLDFADLRGVEEVKQSLRASIDDVNASRSAIDESLQAFDDLLKAANDALREQSFKTSSSQQKLEASLHAQHIPSILRNLESNATEAASHLESLVRHYDLCVTAVKHTEGGLTALTSQPFNASESLNLPAGVDVATHDAQQVPEPISEEERMEMISVIENDALEVDSVVAEIVELLKQMESGLERMTAYHGKVDADYARITHAYALLEDINKRLPDITTEVNAFAQTWTASRESIHGGMLDLSDLRDFYAGFFSAYAGLQSEIKRRKVVRRTMETVIEDAQSMLQKLYEEDLAEREKFHLDQGQFLPSNIWPGISEKPDLWRFERVDGEMQMRIAEEMEADRRAEGDESVHAEGDVAVE